MGLGTVQQVLLTRFNVSDPDVPGHAGVSRQWMDDRFELFARYCVPSIVAQTLEDFEWIIFCDEGTPSDDLVRIQSCDPRIRIALTARDISLPTARQATPPDHPEYGPVLRQLRIHPFVRDEAEVVISTRLERDAALHRGALARLRAYLEPFLASGAPAMAYNLVLGYRFDVQTRLLEPISRRDSSFQSWMERVTPERQVLGALDDGHGTPGQRLPRVDDEGARLWMVVQHGGSVPPVIHRRPDELEHEALLQAVPAHLGSRKLDAVTPETPGPVESSADHGEPEAPVKPPVPVLRANPLQVTVVDDGLVLPSEFLGPGVGPPTHRGGVVTQMGEAVPSANLYRGGGKLAFGGTGEIAVPDARTCDEEVIYLGWCHHHHYGLFLLETLARAWYTLIADAAQRVVLLPHVRPPLSATVLRLLELLDIPEERVLLVTEPTRFSRIYVPDVAYELLGSAHEEAIRPFAQMTERVLGNSQPDSSPQPVYLSQGGMPDQHRIAVGERDLEAALRERGYRIVYPEMLTVDEQIRVFNEHTDYVGIYGAPCHAVLFSRQRPTLHLLAGDRLPLDYQLTPALAGASAETVQCLADAPDAPGRKVLDVARALAYLDDEALKRPRLERPG